MLCPKTKLLSISEVNLCCALQGEIHRDSDIQALLCSASCLVSISIIPSSSVLLVTLSKAQVLCIVDALKAAGQFTAVALTMPFEFEGRRRMEMAMSLLQALQKAADAVCVIQQVWTIPTSSH